MRGDRERERESEIERISFAVLMEEILTPRSASGCLAECFPEWMRDEFKLRFTGNLI